MEQSTFTGRHRARWRVIGVVVAATLLAAGPAGAVGGPETDTAPSGGTIATFNGSLIDLGEDWEGAAVCIVGPEVLSQPECYETEAEAEARLDQLAPSGDATAAAVDGQEPVALAASNCASYLKLYDGYFYTGASLWLLGRGYWRNLSLYGFDQTTSSFKVGACSAYMADWADGGGSWYPTSHTQAYDLEPYITGGWNNDISSVYIS